jgi:sugar phosphate isomerase/epimerase
MWSYFPTWKRTEFGIPKFIETVKEIGADGVELLDFFWKDRSTEEPLVLDALARTGIKVGVYSVSNNFVSKDPADREKAANVIIAGVDSAVKFGAGVVRVYAGNVKDDISFEQAFDWIVEGLKIGAAYAESKGVKLALENHGKLAGKSGQVLKILDAVGSPALGANPDTGNFLLVRETPFEAVKALSKRINMVHFKDFHNVPDEWQGFAYTSLDGAKFVGKAVGEGDVDLASVVAALKADGFDGWLNIEYEGEEDPLVAVKRSVESTLKLLAA